MSERISVVVPDGTIERLKKTAEFEKRSQSSLSRKFIMDGLSFCEPHWQIVPGSGKFHWIDLHKSKDFFKNSASALASNEIVNDVKDEKK